ncbi:MAG: MerR family transcriptional regulator [Ruminococcus sp.]|nr:MerR family transcriptional regulator [Ruminococcus sp.]
MVMKRDVSIDSTTNESDYSLFTIRQAAHACNISRSSLIRLEEKGLLTPAYIDAKSKYRYYDNNNVSRILQIQKFQWMGFSSEEILSYYASGGRADGLLATLEQKLSILQQQVEEMRLRSHNVPNRSLSIIKIPETVCCVRRFQGPLVQDKYHASYDFFHECVEKGIALAPEPFFIINERTDYLEGKLSSAPFDSYICIPVLPEQAPEDVVHVPACTALSLLCYGNYSKIDEAYLYLGEQLHKRGLTPAGYVRAIALVAPYVGKEIDPQRYCSQLVLPVEDTIVQEVGNQE